MTQYTQEDFDAMVQAIRRFADEEMGQFALFRFNSRYGNVYVRITRQLPVDEPLSRYPSYEPGEAPSPTPPPGIRSASDQSPRCEQQRPVAPDLRWSSTQRVRRCVRRDWALPHGRSKTLIQPNGSMREELVRPARLLR
jgi:hypothetical protein